MTTDPVADAGLFDMTAPLVSLADRFGVPPFSILDRRQGSWQDRKRAWASLGIQSELGRDAVSYHLDETTMPYASAAALGGTSIFDPVVCELAYRWFTVPGWRVLDPFAGGSVRGIVAGVLGRRYLGVDLRTEQVDANNAQAGLAPADTAPAWVVGDSRQVVRDLPAGALADFVFTCPPYADLEVYSDDPADLSTMGYPEFLSAQLDIITACADRLRPNRFMAWVTSDVRDKRRPGSPYRGLVSDTICAAQAAGLDLYNDLVILDPVGTGAVRAGKQFTAGRKVIRMHQHLLVFVKGDGMAAGKEIEAAGGRQAADDAERAMLGAQ